MPLMSNRHSKRPSNTGSYHSPRIESFLFLIIISIEAGFILYLIQKRLLVGGHDGFNFFSLQYYFLNNVVNYDEIPQWSPFMMHGTIFTFGYVLLGGILINVFFLFGGLTKYFNFLPIFYAGMFVDELLLLVGVWLLGRRFFTSPFTVFFVALSIMGSCIWLLQPLFNFHFYYAIPLILHYVHSFLDSGKWRYCFLSGNLLLMQFFGNLHYALPVTTLVIFLYFLFYFIINYKDTWHKIITINLGWPSVFITALIVLSFVALHSFLNFGTDQVYVASALRNSDGSSTVDVFLTYGGELSWQIWLELFLGLSPCIDYTLYIGILCVPFIILGLMLNLNKKNAHFFLVIVTLFLLSMGTFVSIFFYYCWPMMEYYRHLVVVSTTIKIFLCFLAGFGLEAIFFNNMGSTKSATQKKILIIISIFMLGASISLWILSKNYEFSYNLIRGMVPEFHPFFLTLINKDLVFLLLSRTALFALIASILIVALCLINRENFFLPLIIFFIALHAADIYGFKFFETNIKAIPLNNELYKITEFQSMPYAKRRDASFWNNNPRAELLKGMPVVADSGSFYWTVNAFVFKDQLGNPFRTDFWMLPLDNYMKAYWGQPLHDLSVKPHGLFHRSGQEYPRLEFPQRHPAILKISGVAEDKIQFFSQADIVSSEDIIVSNITNADYKGDIVFLSPLEKDKNRNSGSQSEFLECNLSSNKRLRLAYQVQRFDANNLVVTTNINDLESAWLFYSDVWHPLWQATVNGEKTPVYKANLAYKAVKLEKGFNEVHFFFKSAVISFFHYVVGLNSLFWLLMIIGLAGKILFCRKAGFIGPTCYPAPLTD